MNGDKTKVLIVEHDQNDLDLIAYELKKGGIAYVSEIVKNEGDFRNALMNFIPDIILSDFALPAFDGPTAFKIREALAPDTPFIFVSGTIGEETSIEFIKKGVTDYVLKDKLFTLATKVKRALSEAKEKQQKKRIEQERIESESRLKEAQTLSHIGSWEIDMVRKTDHWSDELFNILGIKKDQATASTELFLSSLHPDDLVNVTKINEMAYKTLKDSSFNFRFIRKDGAIRHGYSKYHFDFDKNQKPVRLSGIVQDVTEKKLANEALRTTHERLIFHIENAPLGFIEWDIHLHLKSWSKRAEEIFGWTESEFNDAQKDGYSEVYKDDLPWVSKLLSQLISGEVTRNKVQYRNYTKDGRVIWCEWFNSVLKDDAGKVTTIMSLVQDITEQKTSDVVKHERLEKLVEERTHELNVALTKEKDLVEMKNRFVSIASHEFRTPLSTISFAAESIRNYFHQLTAEEIRRKLIKIEDQVSHMTNLLDDILTLGKSGAGKIKVKKTSLDLKAFVESLIEEVLATFKGKRRIDFTFSCIERKVNADDKLLRNVFTNLLNNAIKFSAPGTVVTVVVSDEKGKVLIQVTDKGIGIEDSECNSIFESFHRGSNASTIQGTGLGLSILKKAVELMEGSIEVHSKINKGSTFKVLIPMT